MWTPALCACVCVGVCVFLAVSGDTTTLLWLYWDTGLHNHYQRTGRIRKTASCATKLRWVKAVLYECLKCSSQIILKLNVLLCLVVSNRKPLYLSNVSQIQDQHAAQVLGLIWTPIQFHKFILCTNFLSARSVFFNTTTSGLTVVLLSV